jgi:hypothetical protein
LPVAPLFPTGCLQNNADVAWNRAIGEQRNGRYTDVWRGTEGGSRYPRM